MSDTTTSTEQTKRSKSQVKADYAQLCTLLGELIYKQRMMQRNVDDINNQLIKLDREYREALNDPTDKQTETV